MELSDLKIFLIVAEEGSISRAAERLQYVQSNVTARIRKLESELEVSLFHRHPKGLTLTEKGSTFREYALRITDLSREAMEVVQKTPYPSGPLSVGVVETMTCGNLMHVLSEFQNKYPDVSLSLITGNSSELISKVHNHQLDGAFVTGHVQSGKLICDYRIHEEIVLLSRAKGDAYPNLSTTKWAVSPKGCPFRDILEKWLHSEGLQLKNTIEISSLETLLSCVRSGLASTLLPASVLKGMYVSLGAHPIPESFRFTHSHLIRHKERFISNAFGSFIEMVKAHGL